MKNLSGFDSFSYLLFPVNQFHPDAVFPVQMLGCMLGRIDRTVLAARTSEANLEMSKPSFQIAFHMSIHQRIGMFQKTENLTVLFRKRITGSSLPVNGL